MTQGQEPAAHAEAGENVPSATPARRLHRKRVDPPPQQVGAEPPPTRAMATISELEALINAHPLIRQVSIEDFMLRWIRSRDSDLRRGLVNLLEPIPAREGRRPCNPPP